MEPIPETLEAIEDFEPFLPDHDLLSELRQMTTRVQEIVPDCVGVSLARSELGVTFTLVATDRVIAGLDGLQYVENGPCVEAVELGEVVTFSTPSALDEHRWQLFARGTAAAGVASTLTLPIMVEDEAVGSVNLYAATATAFDGKHEAVAEVFCAWAPDAVTNADLSFETRRVAQQAPRLLRDEMRINTAIGILAASEDVSLEESEARLRDAAARAGLSPQEMAERVIDEATGTDRHPWQDGPGA